MRQDLLKILEGSKEATNVIILTHNIDFIFIQSVVLSALKRCGHPKLTIFSDANCAADTFASQSPVLNNLGIRYRVVPVEMPQGFHFHPKTVLISGPEKAFLLVGSGNLTFGGWRENAEAWLLFDTDADGTGPFAAFFQYLWDILQKVPLKESIEAEIKEAFDPRTRLWAGDLGKPERLLWKMGAGQTLIDRVYEFLDKEPVTNLTVCSPYFDQDARAIGGILERLSPIHADILFQNGRSTLYKNAATKLPMNVRVLPIEFRSIEEDGPKRRRFIHAKFYGVEQGEKVTVFIGSANCSNAAFMIPGKSGNAELMAVQTLNRKEFKEEYLSEIEFIEDEAQLKDHEAENDRLAIQDTSIRILAARFEQPRLFVAYSCPPDLLIQNLLIDDQPHEFEILEFGVAFARIESHPHLVMLRGIHQGSIVHSKTMWIDHERALRSSARGRSLTEAIRNRVQPGYWDFDTWTEIVEVFYKNIQYIQPHIAFPHRKNIRKEGEAKVVEYSQIDVFSGSYNLPYMKSTSFSLGTNERIRSLQQMLLRWFSIERTPEFETELQPEHVDDDDDDDDEIVDKPEKLPSGSSKIPENLKEISGSHQKRIKKILEKINEKMTSAEYLENREPESIGADLKLISALLRIGLNEKWIDKDTFFQTTHQIWSTLFFSSKGQPTVGWLERRYQNAESQEDFVSRIKSADLSAAFAAWAMAMPHNVNTASHLRFILSCILSVARLPWLWLGDEDSRIASVLEQTLVLTSNSQNNRRIDWEFINQEWKKTIRRGLAFREFEKAMEGHTPVEIKDQITQDEISKGELLWQGVSGLCVATQPCKRSSPDSVKVLKLQGQKGEVAFAPTFTIPIRALLDNPEILSGNVLGIAQRKEIKDFLGEISREFSKDF